MRCEECQNMINDYIDDTLDENTMLLFVNHVRNCKSCKEELQINYSILTALKQIDSGDDFSENYEGELEQKLTSFIAEKKRKTNLYMLFLALIFAASLLLTLFSMMVTNEGNIIYSQNKDADIIDFNYEGLNEKFDPVEKIIKECNNNIINYILNQKGENDSGKCK